MKKLSKWLLLILFIALILRIVVMSWSLQFRENTDVLRYKDWARIGYLYGFANTYNTENLTFGTLANNQPPGSLYVLSAAYNLELQTAKIIFKLTNTSPENNQFVNGPLVTVFLRLPSILADLILGILIYFFVKKFTNEKSALLGSSLFLFAPPIWYNSAFWGQMDAINNLVFFIAFYLLYKEKYFFAILFSLLSLLIKFSLLPLLPLIIYEVFNKQKKSLVKFSLTVIVCIISIILLTLPVAGSNIFWIIEFIKNNSLGEMQHVTNFAFNLWWVIFHPVIIFGNPDNIFTFSEIRLVNSPLDKSIWAFTLFAIFCFPIIKKIIFLRDKIFYPKNFILILCLLSLMVFLLLPGMHERYLYPLFPFLAILIGLSGKYLKTFILLSIFNFINLYIVWHPMKLWILPHEIISNSDFQWLISFCIVLVSLTFYYKTIRFDFINEKNK